MLSLFFDFAEGEFTLWDRIVYLFEFDHLIGDPAKTSCMMVAEVMPIEDSLTSWRIIRSRVRPKNAALQTLGACLLDTSCFGRKPA